MEFHGFEVVEGGVAVAVALVFLVVGHRLAAQPEKKHVVTAFGVAWLGICAVSLWTFVAAQVMAALARNNHAVSLNPSQSELTMRHLHAKAVYESLDAVPIIDIPSTAGWEDPIPDPAAWGGIVLVLLKFIVIVVIARVFYRLWTAVPKMRRGLRARGKSEVPADASHDSTPRSDSGDSAKDGVGHTRGPHSRTS